MSAIVKILDAHVRGRSLQRDDEILWKQIHLVVRIDEDVRKWCGCVSDVLRSRHQAKKFANALDRWITKHADS